MEFVGRTQQPEELKNAVNSVYGTSAAEPQPEEKRITRDEFEAAMHATVDNLVNDSKLEGMAKMMIPLTGMTFARQMEDILFGEKDG